MHVRDEEIGVESGEIKWNVADSVGAVDKREYAFFFADFSEGFEGDAETRQ